MLADIIAALVRIICGASIVSQDSSAASRQKIYFANHSSHLDFLLIWAALPPAVRRKTRPVAAADYWLKGGVRRFLAENVFRAVLIDRKSGNREGAVQQMVSALREKDSLIIFPEGTRSPEGELQPFKSGIFYLAKECPEVPLTPVYLQNLNRVLPKGEFLIVPLLSTVQFGNELNLFESEGKEEFLMRARNSIVSLMEA